MPATGLAFRKALLYTLNVNTDDPQSTTLTSAVDQTEASQEVRKQVDAHAGSSVDPEFEEMKREMKRRVEELEFEERAWRPQRLEKSEAEVYLEIQKTGCLIM